MAAITIAKAKKKVIEAFMKQFRGKPCEVCGSTFGTVAHHFVGKGNCPRHIVTPENIIVLCQRHHGPYGKVMNAHSGDPFLANAFQDWVKENRPELVAWGEEHRNDTVQKCGKVDWLGLYEELSNK